MACGVVISNNLQNLFGVAENMNIESWLFSLQVSGELRGEGNRGE